MTNSRRKGKVGELEAANLWRRWFPDCRRSFGQARDGYEQPDLIGGVEKDFYIEVKRYKRVTSLMRDKWWLKADQDHIKWQKENDPHDTSRLILMYRIDRQPHWTIILDYWTWRMLNRLHNSRMATNFITDVSWPDFQAVLDKVYPIKEDI